jgi:hypothetical protein
MEGHKMAKRVGLGRTQKLIEELKREIQLNGASFVGGDRGVKHVTTGGAGTTVLGVEDSGKLILIDGSAEGNHTITLPLATVSSGLEFLIILKADSHANTEILLDSGVTNGIKGMLKKLAASAIANVLAHSNQNLGFGDASKLGSRIHLISDGTQYWAVDAVSDVVHVSAFS